MRGFFLRTPVFRARARPAARVVSRGLSPRSRSGSAGSRLVPCTPVVACAHATAQATRTHSAAHLDHSWTCAGQDIPRGHTGTRTRARVQSVAPRVSQERASPPGRVPVAMASTRPVAVRRPVAGAAQLVAPSLLVRRGTRGSASATRRPTRRADRRAVSHPRVDPLRDPRRLVSVAWGALRLPFCQCSFEDRS